MLGTAGGWDNGNKGGGIYIIYRRGEGQGSEWALRRREHAREPRAKKKFVNHA